MEIEQKNSARILPWAYIILLYTTTLYTFIGSALALGSKSGDALGFICLAIGIILYLALITIGIANCVMAWVNCRSNREDYLRGCVVILKYATIPFHLGCAALILTGSLIFIFGGMVLIIVGMILQGGVFIIGICYSWSYMVVTVRNHRRTTGMGILHGLLLATYVVDVIDTVVLMLKQKKYVAVSVVVIIGIVLGLIWLLFQLRIS